MYSWHLEGDLLLISRQGMSIRFPLDSVSVQGRIAGGVRGMALDPETRSAGSVPLGRRIPGDSLLRPGLGQADARGLL